MSRGRALIEEEGERLGVRSRTLPMPERRRRRDVGTAGADAGASQRDIEGGRAVRPCGRAVLRTRTRSRGRLVVGGGVVARVKDFNVAHM